MGQRFKNSKRGEERSFSSKRKNTTNRNSDRFEGEGRRKSTGDRGKRVANEKPNKPNYENIKETLSESSDAIRLNRYVANAGVCSRREADKLIADGLITVNGKVVTEMGVQVSRKDKVEYEGRILSAELKVYVLLNKPKDVVTTLGDPHAKRTVMDLVREACDERIYPVGRLDKNTTGVLLLTNDGELTKRLTHPKYRHRKIYHAFLDKPVLKKDIEAIAQGIKLEDGEIAADAISYVEGDKQQVGIEIHSGKNRIVRRIFEHFGYNVVKLDRVYFSGLTKKGIGRGEWRYLSEKEVKQLKSGMLG